jgi:hypothetical protein
VNRIIHAMIICVNIEGSLNVIANG